MRTVFFLLLCVLLVSCGQERKNPPAHSSPSGTDFVKADLRISDLDSFSEPLQVHAEIMPSSSLDTLRMELTVFNPADRVQEFTYARCFERERFLVSDSLHYEIIEPHDCYLNVFYPFRILPKNKARLELEVRWLGLSQDSVNRPFRMGIRMRYGTCWSNELIPSVI